MKQPFPIRIVLLLAFLPGMLPVVGQRLSLVNPLDSPRPDELIILTRASVEKQLGPLTAGLVIDVWRSTARGEVKARVGQAGGGKTGQAEKPVLQFVDLDGDGKWDEAVFLQTFRAKETLYFKITAARANERAFPSRAHVRMMRKNPDDSFGPLLARDTMPPGNPPTDFSQHRLPGWLTEGPAWENDKTAFRLYFDTRNNKDIYGKTTDKMVMDEVGVDPSKSYHELSWWGMDILKVGNSLGAGALAVSLPRQGMADTLVRLGGKSIRGEIFERVADGPVLAIFRMRYDWDLAGTPVQLTEETRIWGGQFFYETAVTLSGAPVGAKLVSGIANFYTNEPGHFTEAAGAVLFSHGRQAENGDWLGMAILTDKKDGPVFDSLPAGGGLPVASSYIVSRPVKKQEPMYARFYTGWERTDKRFSEPDYFREFLKTQAQGYSHPIRQRWVPK